MKFFILFLGVMIHGFAFAQPQCSIQSVEIAIQDCSLKLDGLYSLKLCDNGRGLLSKKDGWQRNLFKIGETWMARLDLVDSTDNVVTTDVLQINKDNTVLSAWETKTNGSGVILSQVQCSGSIKLQ